MLINKCFPVLCRDCRSAVLWNFSSTLYLQQLVIRIKTEHQAGTAYKSPLLLSLLSQFLYLQPLVLIAMHDPIFWYLFAPIVALLAYKLEVFISWQLKTTKVSYRVLKSRANSLIALIINLVIIEDFFTQISQLKQCNSNNREFKHDVYGRRQTANGRDYRLWFSILFL